MITHNEGTTFRSVGVGTSSRPSAVVRVLGRHSRVVRTVQTLSSGLAILLATVAALAVLPDRPFFRPDIS
jgi:hypothetical protein